MCIFVGLAITKQITCVPAQGRGRETGEGVTEMKDEVLEGNDM